MDSRSVEVGGYSSLSDPVTRQPLSWRRPASAAIPVPPIPMR
jgi:hypothetical protein